GFPWASMADRRGAHGLIHKLPHTHRYRVSENGRLMLNAILSAHRRQGEAERLAKAAQGVADILRQRVQPREFPHCTAVFHRESHASERPTRPAPSLLGRRARAARRLLRHLAVDAQFVGKIRLEVAASRQLSNSLPE